MAGGERGAARGTGGAARAPGPAWAGMRAIAPMLATPGRLPPDDEDALYGYEVKWDGVRAVGYLSRDEFKLVSRNDRDITVAYPELEPPRRLAEGGLVVDGEIIAFDDAGRPSFGALQPRMHLRDPARIARRRERTPVVYVLFDVLRYDGERITGREYRQRREVLDSLDLSSPATWRRPAYRVGDGARMYESTRESGLEGVMAKRLASPYRPGRRSADWLKIKHVRTQEVVVGGWTPGEGRRRGTFGSLLLGIPDGGSGLAFVGLVGSGFTDRTLADLDRRLAALSERRSPFGGPIPGPIAREARWVRPELVGEVVYSERTRDGMLRSPVWRGLRPDKSPEDVSVE